MSQKPAAIILGLGRKGLFFRGLSARLPLLRSPRRLFSQKVIIEDGDPPLKSSGTKYRPDFVIDFTNHRFTIYRNVFRINTIVTGVAVALFLYSLYQVAWKWKQNNKIKSIVCLWVLIITSAFLAFNVNGARGAVRKINLMDTGRTIEVFEVYGLRPTTIPILEITPKSPEEVLMSNMMNVSFFEFQNKRFLLNPFEDKDVTSPDPKLVKAVTDRIEVDVGTSSSHPTIDL
jgi:hypothetical protein